MFPLRDDNPQLATPWGTYSLIALNILAWLIVQTAGGGDGLQRAVCTFGLIPAEFTVSYAKYDNACIAVNTGALTWLTSMFMHGGWMHIIGNLWFLWIFGDNVEDAMGTKRFIAFYLLAGFAAAAAQFFSAPQSPIPMVGASGAIGGVMGAYFLLYPKVRVTMAVFLLYIFTTIRVPAFAVLLYWLAVQSLSALSAAGTTGGVAFWAHIGGFLAGAALVHLFKNKTLLNKHPHHGW